MDIEKRCTKCGVQRKYKPRIRYCREVKMKGGYWCYGKLEVVQVEQKPGTRRPQDVAQRKLQLTERAIDEVNDLMFSLAARIGRLTKRSKVLSAKARRYAAAASMTDEEVEQQRQRRQALVEKRSASQRTRHIDLDE